MALSIPQSADTGRQHRTITRSIRGTDMPLTAFYSTTAQAPVVGWDRYGELFEKDCLTLDEAAALSEALGELVAAVR